MQMKYFNAVIPGILARLPEPQCENFKNLLSQSNHYYPEAIFSIMAKVETVKKNPYPNVIFFAI